MKSAITFDSKKDDVVEVANTVADLFYLCAVTAKGTKKRVEVIIQHSLNHDELAMVVEFPDVSFQTHSKDPLKVFRFLSEQVIKYGRETRNEHENEQEKKRSPRKKGSGGRRGKSTAGKRGSRVLQRGRSKGR